MNIISLLNGEKEYYTPFYPISDGKIVQKIFKGDLEVWNNYCVENDACDAYLGNVNYSVSAKTVAEFNSAYSKLNPEETNVLKNGAEDPRPSGVTLSEFSKVSKFRENLPLPTLGKWTEKPKPILLNTEGANSIIISSQNDNTLELTCDSKITKIYNLKPNCTYTYTLDNGRSGSFTTGGIVRMINIPGIRNVRDLGGWPTTNDKLILYGKVYRGSMPNVYYPSTDSFNSFTRDNCTIPCTKECLDTYIPYLGISAQLDLRDADSSKTSPSGKISYSDSKIVMCLLHPNVQNYTTGMGGAYTDLVGRSLQYLIGAVAKSAVSPSTTYWKRLISCLLDIINGKILYIHCVDGHDRTATIAAIIEGLCGATNDSILKDYEMSSFAVTSKYIDSGLSLVPSSSGTYYGDDESPALMFCEWMSYYLTSTKATTAATSSVGINLCDCILNWFKYWYSLSGYETISGYTSSSIILAILDRLVTGKMENYTTTKTGDFIYTSGYGYSADTGNISENLARYYVTKENGIKIDSDGVFTVTNTNNVRITYVVLENSESEWVTVGDSLDDENYPYAHGEILGLGSRTFEVKAGNIVVAISNKDLSTDLNGKPVTMYSYKYAAEKTTEEAVLSYPLIEEVSQATVESSLVVVYPTEKKGVTIIGLVHGDTTYSTLTNGYYSFTSGSSDWVRLYADTGKLVGVTDRKSAVVKVMYKIGNSTYTTPEIYIPAYKDSTLTNCVEITFNDLYEKSYAVSTKTEVVNNQEVVTKTYKTNYMLKLVKVPSAVVTALKLKLEKYRNIYVETVNSNVDLYFFPVMYFGQSDLHKTTYIDDKIASVSSTCDVYKKSLNSVSWTLTLNKVRGDLSECEDALMTITATNTVFVGDVTKNSTFASKEACYNYISNNLLVTLDKKLITYWTAKGITKDTVFAKIWY